MSDIKSNGKFTPYEAKDDEEYMNAAQKAHFTQILQNCKSHRNK